MASIKQFQVTFDCAEPERVTRFRCEVLGYVVPPPAEGFATWDDLHRTLPPKRQGSAFACVDPTGVGPRLPFQRVPEGKVVKNRLHLDLRIGTGLVSAKRLAVLQAERARLVTLGAEVRDYCRPRSTKSILFQYSRAAKELWKFCNLTNIELTASRVQEQPSIECWERAAPAARSGSREG